MKPLSLFTVALLFPGFAIAQDDAAFLERLHSVEKAFKGDDPVAWEGALDELKELVNDTIKNEESHKHAEHAVNLMLIFSQRSDFEKKITYPHKDAYEHSRISSAVKEALEEQGHADQVTVTWTHDRVYESILWAVHGFKEGLPPATSQSLRTILSNTPQKPTLIEVAVDAADESGLLDDTLKPVLLKWLDHQLDDWSYFLISKGCVDAEVHRKVVEGLKPWEIRISKGRRLALPYLRPSKDQARQIAQAACAQLLEVNTFLDLRDMLLPVLVLMNPNGAYSGSLNEADLQKLQAGMEKRPRFAGIMQWMMLLGPKQEDNFALLHRCADQRIPQVAHWEYLPGLMTPKESIKFPDTLKSTVHELFLYALLPDYKPNAAALAALENYSDCTLKENVAYQHHFSGTPMQMINHWSAFSILWRSKEDPAAFVQHAWVGRKARSARQGHSDSYSLAFCKGRVKASGEPDLTKFQDTLKGPFRIYLAISYPESKFAQEAVAELVRDHKEKLLDFWFLEDIYYAKALMKTWAKIPGLREFFIEGFEVFKREPDAICRLTSILYSIWKDESGKPLLEELVKANYVEPRHVRAVWGLDIKCLAEMDPENPLLDRFEKRLEDKPKEGRDLALWLLRLLRGQKAKAGRLPLHDLRYVLARATQLGMIMDLVDVDEHLMVERAALRDPHNFSCCLAAGADQVAGEKGAACIMAFLGLLDRLEWKARKLPEPLEPDTVSWARVREEYEKKKKEP